ncbi:hypothetical protein ACFVX9_39455, partial [Kitasatospora sp. NPDC058243]|uniref:hypothetical protein n=1 Tax=Kitasatospora sp. NPDC058243 TaxID=3346397 RepID=UPI0036DBF587
MSNNSDPINAGTSNLATKFSPGFSSDVLSSAVQEGAQVQDGTFYWGEGDRGYETVVSYIYRVPLNGAPSEKICTLSAYDPEKYSGIDGMTLDTVSGTLYACAETYNRLWACQAVVNATPRTLVNFGNGSCPGSLALDGKGNAYVRGYGAAGLWRVDVDRNFFEAIPISGIS